MAVSQVTTSATSPRAARTDSTIAGSDVAWTNPVNALTQNDTNATCALNNQQSQSLYVFDFNLAIPSNATIDGILVEVEKFRSAGTGTLADLYVRLVRKGSIQASGRNQASTVAWATSDTDAYTSYGGSDDLWGWPWTPTDLNDPFFGVIFAAEETASLAATASIDHIRVTVTYTQGYDSAPQVQERAVIQLGGRYYNLATEEGGRSGKVRETLATVPSPKIDTGGTVGRPTNRFVETYVVSDLRGGMGLRRYRTPEDLNRFWTGENINALRANITTLAPLASSTGQPANGGTPNTGADNSLATFRGVIVTQKGTTLHSYNGSAWTTSNLATFTQQSGENATLFNGRLFYPFLSGDGYAYHSTVATPVTVTEVASPRIDAFAVWDNKLYGIDKTTGVLVSSTTGDSGTWITLAAVPEIDANGTNLQIRLIVYRDASGDPVLWAVTTSQAAVYDAVNDKWFTAYRFPLVRHFLTRTVLATVWRESLYIKVGIRELAKLTMGGGSLTVESIPLAADDVTLTQMHEFVAFAPTNNLLLVLMNAGAQDIDYGGSGRKVAVYNGLGFHPVYVSTVSSAAVRTMLVSDQFTDRRVYFGDHDTTDQNYIRSMSLSALEANPLFNTFATYAASGNVELPIYDAWAPEQPKTALQVRLKLLGAGPVSAAPTETVQVAYRLNGSTGSYTNLGSAVAVNDEVTIPFGTGNVGLGYKSIQFRWTFASAGSTAAPKMEYFAMDFVRGQEVLRAFQVKLSLLENAWDRTPQQQYDALYAALKADTLLTFAYRDDTNNVRSYVVKAVAPEGAFETGYDFSGELALTLVEFNYG